MHQRTQRGIRQPFIPADAVRALLVRRRTGTNRKTDRRLFDHLSAHRAARQIGCITAFRHHAPFKRRLNKRRCPFLPFKRIQRMQQQPADGGIILIRRGERCCNLCQIARQRIAFDILREREKRVHRIRLTQRVAPAPLRQDKGGITKLPRGRVLLFPPPRVFT